MGSIFQSVIIIVTCTLLEYECEVLYILEDCQLHWLESVIFLGCALFLWDSIDQREGERGLNISLCGGIYQHGGSDPRQMRN